MQLTSHESLQLKQSKTDGHMFPTLENLTLFWSVEVADLVVKQNEY